MMRLFDDHQVRRSLDLGGAWDFVAAPQVRRTDAAGLPTRFPGRMHVPGCWENHPEWRSYRGKAWYRRRFV